VTTVLLDTHVVYWRSSESHRLSRAAASAIARADELAVASIVWYELASLAHRSRIRVPVPARSWLDDLSSQVRTVGITRSIAITAASLAGSFSGDPIDRLIYATAIEEGWLLVSKDERMRAHGHPRRIVIW
jgi:PIN domain nuclease of toxin-antitoxin system